MIREKRAILLTGYMTREEAQTLCHIIAHIAGLRRPGGQCKAMKYEDKELIDEYMEMF